MTTCIFCHIVERTKPSHIVYEDDQLLAFLDARPLFPGHCLLVPKAHVETFYDMPDDLIQPFFGKGQVIGRAIEKGMQAKGSFIAMNNKISQSVPHVHMHMVPRNPQDGLKGFFWPRQTYRDEAHKQEVVAQIKKHLQA